MGNTIDWKKLKRFFKADVLKECSGRVAEENIRMLYLVNTAFVIISVLLWLYTGLLHDLYYFDQIYFLFIVLAIVGLVYIRFVIEKKRNRIPSMIVSDYIVLNCYLLWMGIHYHNDMPATGLYVFVALAVCFLIKPLHLIILQVTTALIYITFTVLCKPHGVAEWDIINVTFMTVMSCILGCTIIKFRMKSLRKLEKNDQILRVTRLYQSILDETNTGVVVHDIETGEMFYGNKGIREIYGFTGELLKQGPESALVKERGKKHIDLDIKALKAGASNEATEFREDGRIFHVKGKVIDWYGRDAYVEYMMDVTDSKKFSEQLQLAHEELQRKYQEEMLYREKAVSDDIIASSRINLTYGYIEEMCIGKKDGFEKQYHYAMDLVSRIAAFTNEIWLTEEQNRRMSAPYFLERYAKGDRRFSEVYAAELKDGRHVWIRTDANLVQRPETAEIVAFCYSRDVTKEKVLTQSLEKIMSFEYDEIYMVDVSNGITTAVATGEFALAEQMIEGTFEQGLENLKQRIDSEEDIRRLEEKMNLATIQKQLEDHPVYMFEIRLLSKSGKRRQKQLRFMYLSEIMGTLLFTITDVEDVVKAEKEKQERLAVALESAEKANAVKTNFLASMSHEIRTPMNAIIGLTSIIKEEADDKQKVLDSVGKLDSASRYLLALLNDILDMSRIESGKMELQHQEFSIRQFWEAVNTLAEAQARPAHIQYIFEHQLTLTEEYVGDAVRLQQIMVNLINNAIKFTGAGGTVKVSVEQPEKADGRAKLRVKVADNGIGISKEFLPNVFNVFAQEHDGTTSVYGGSGLGLAIARNYARMMGGDIFVESEVGVGTTFITEVWLDIASEPIQKSDNEAQAPASIQREEVSFEGKQILLVEDHPLNTLVASRLLAKRGIKVVHADDGEKAVKLFSQSAPFEFNAILMDIRMPVMDGIEATKEIRALPREDALTVPIIAMTANAYEEDRQTTKEAGMNAHLAKPIEPHLLYETLEAFL